jgi:hypothetical protein
MAATRDCDFVLCFEGVSSFSRRGAPARSRAKREIHPQENLPDRLFRDRPMTATPHKVPPHYEVGMIRLFEERLYRRAYARAQGPRAALQLSQIDSQLRRLGARGGADTSGFYRDPYFNAYVLGVLESVTKFYETETRRRIGVSLHEDFFVGYLCKRFTVSRDEARQRFAGVIESLEKNGTSSGYADGCADGQALRQGGPAQTRLLWHMAGRNAPPRTPQAAPRRDAVAQDIRAPILVTSRQAV